MTFWRYSETNQRLILSYLFGNISEEPADIILSVDDSWLGNIFKNNPVSLIRTEKPSMEHLYHKTWLNICGDGPVIAVPLISQEGSVYGVITLHFLASESLREEIIQKTTLYFRKCSPIIEAENAKNQNRRGEKFKGILSHWVSQKDLEGFYMTLAKGVSDIIEESSCSVFMRSDIEKHRVKLIATTSDRIKTEVGKCIYNLISAEKKDLVSYELK